MYGADPWVKKFVSVNQRYLTLSHTLQSKLYDLESDVKPSNNPLHCYKTIYAKDSLERTIWLWKLVFCRVFLYYWHPQETVQVILWVPVAYESRPPSNPQHFNLLMTLNLPELLVTQRSYQPYFIGRQNPKLYQVSCSRSNWKSWGEPVSQDLQDCFLLKLLRDNWVHW